MTLAEYVQAEAAKPFALGENDCAHFIARWALARTGRDGLAIFNGLRRDIAADLVERKQLLRAVFQGCRSIGLERAREPAAGDIGVIRTIQRHRCAIRTDRGWVFREEAGIGSARAEDCHLLMAWRT
jgi:hypothetical protein